MLLKCQVSTATKKIIEKFVEDRLQRLTWYSTLGDVQLKHFNVPIVQTFNYLPVSLYWSFYGQEAELNPIKNY